MPACLKRRADLQTTPLFLPVRRFLLALLLILAAGAPPARIAASDPGTGDWPMWGGTPDRNMVSNMKGLPRR